MEKQFSIIYANRNRDCERIEKSLESLAKQAIQNFEVIFVDYGSDPEMVSKYKKLSDNFSFVNFFPLHVRQLLWNKSKALNYGIKKATFPYVFIADVDLIFHPDSLSLFSKLVIPEKFYLFKLGYLNEVESEKLNGSYNFGDLKPERFGTVNGMVLAGKQAFMDVNGLDEFFHFYGAEDEDLFARLQKAGYEREALNFDYFYHNWHKSFSGSESKVLTRNPRIRNIMRINQRHFQRNKQQNSVQPFDQPDMGEIVSPERAMALENPTKHVVIENIMAHVEHFLREELPNYRDEIINVEFVEAAYYRSLKFKIKKLLGKQSQPYISMKEVNDMVLKEILFNYRNSNYSIRIASNLKRITFCVEL